jgi:hypothetical protein
MVSKLLAFFHVVKMLLRLVNDVPLPLHQPAEARLPRITLMRLKLFVSRFATSQ